MNLKESVSFSKTLAKESGKIILSHYLDAELQVEFKEDNTPVTLADRKAEARMREMIEENYPEHGIIGEEHGDIRQNAEYVWLLDPIDGTKSFIAGVPLFGTIICLKHNGCPILGVINQPVLRQIIIGHDSQTTLNDSSVTIKEPKDFSQITVLSTDEVDARKRFGNQKWSKFTEQVGTYRTWGDCYGYLLLASGKVDVMIDPIVNAWDFHAMIPIIKGAGGTITDCAGNDPLTGNSVIAAHPQLHSRIIDSLLD
jgi:histidinol phosphatase-like enzyme (inositol monophosphatase family)